MQVQELFIDEMLCMGLWPGEVDHQGKYVNEFNGTLFSYFLFLLCIFFL